MTSYAVYLKKKNFPYPEDVVIGSNKKIGELIEGPADYYRSTIDDALRKLEEKGLVKILDKVSKRKRVAGLTFSGLIWYLQNVKDGFNHIFDYYSGLFPLRTVKKLLLREEYEDLLPFLPLWKTMTKALGEAMCLERIEKTAKDFFALEEVKLKIEAFDFEVEGYLQLPPPGWMKMRYPDYYDRFALRCNGERNQEVVNFIKKPENAMLLKSYIAYLAIHDLNKVAKLTKEQIINLQVNIDSQKETAHFEDRETGINSIFGKGRLQEFFPRYSEIRYFFTGMFVHNLVWSKPS
jgi:DNA-binding PadR family transcriptional regulator